MRMTGGFWFGWHLCYRKSDRNFLAFILAGFACFPVTFHGNWCYSWLVYGWVVPFAMKKSFCLLNSFCLPLAFTQCLFCLSVFLAFYLCCVSIVSLSVSVCFSFSVPLSLSRLFFSFNRHLKLVQKQLKLDKAEMEQLQNARKTFLITAMVNYVRCLQAGVSTFVCQVCFVLKADNGKESWYFLLVSGQSFIFPATIKRLCCCGGELLALIEVW